MTNVQLEQLLQHESFLRGLARSLLRDSARADDVVQEAWLVALRSSKRPDEVQRGWLAGIVRNLVRRVRREETRRARRERIAARGGNERPADEVVADRLLGRRIAEMVLALPEHYREPLLLRYYDGLEPQDIGERLAMSSSTVRTRLQRGLQRVRAQLVDQRNGNGRARALGLALIPLATARTAWRVPRGIAAAILIGATAALWFGVVPALQRTAAARVDAVARADVDRSVAAAVVANETEAPRAIADEPAAGSVLWLVRARVPRGVLTSAVDLVVSAEGSPHRVVRRVEAGARTALAIDALLETGTPARLTIEARHPECLPRSHEVVVPADRVVPPLDLALARVPLVPATSLRIEDPAVRAALLPDAATAVSSSSAAAVELLSAGVREPTRRLVGIVHAPADGPVALRVCRSDGRGVCLRGTVPAGRFFALTVDALLDGALPAAITVEATQASAAPASVDVPVLVAASGEPVFAPFELTLAAGRRIEGRVVAGEPIEGATVAVFAMDADRPEEDPLAAAVTDATGAYGFTVEAVGRVLVVAAVAGRVPAGHVVTLDDQAETPVAVPEHELTAGAAIDGRVVDDGGRGVDAVLRAAALTTADVTLTLTPGAAAIAYRGGELAWQQASARTEADGAYRLAGLAEADHEVTLAAEPDPIVRVAAAPGTVDFVLPSARVDVFVRDSDGVPLAGARVALGASIATTDAAGHAPFSTPPGAMRMLVVTHEEHAETTRAVTAPARGAVLAVPVALAPLSPLATLAVTVRSAAQPVPAAFGFLLTSPLARRPRAVAATMEAGRFVLPDLPPGSYVVSAYPGGASPPATNYYLPASATVTLVAGTTTTLALDLALGGRLDLAIPDGATVWLGDGAVAPRRLSRLAGAFAEPFEGERSSSRWRSPLLEPGRYDVALIPWDPRRGIEHLSVEVLAGQTVRR